MRHNDEEHMVQEESLRNVLTGSVRRIGNLEFRTSVSIWRHPIGHVSPLWDSVTTQALAWLADADGRGLLVGVDLEASPPCILYTGLIDSTSRQSDAALSVPARLQKLDALNSVNRVPLTEVYGLPAEPELDDPDTVQLILTSAACFALNQPEARLAQRFLADQAGDGDGEKTPKGGGKPPPKGGEKEGEGKGESSATEGSSTKVKGKVEVHVKKKQAEKGAKEETVVDVTAEGEVDVEKASVITDLWGLINCTKVKKTKSIKVKGKVTVKVHIIQEVDDGQGGKKMEETDVDITIDAQVEVDVFEEAKKVVEGILGKKLQYEPEVKP